MEHSVDEELHAATIESLERRILDLALERTGARDGAVFLVDEKADGLRLDFHIVGGVRVTLPSVLLRRRRDGRPNGIAFWVRDNAKAYLTNDATRDPNYAAYFLPVHAIAAVPILYQERVIGVVSIASPRRNGFTPEHLDELRALAASAAKFLRRAQLYRAKHRELGREILMKGLSPEWLEVERAIERVAATTAPVLIRGESGTGKELAAHSIHFNSARRDKPFVVVNAAAIPETLLESALFGHVKGAFTGAVEARKGQFVRADGGTLFLDEVGDLAPALQVKLLRATEQGEVLPLGSDEEARRVDVRLVCATNRDLEELIARGQFRSDLYYRIGVVSVRLPPLRSYKDNIPIMAQVFVQQANARYGRSVSRFAPDALAALQGYDYPGNLRELRNIVDFAVLMAAGPEITAAELPPTVAKPASKPSPRPRTLRELRTSWMADEERRYLAALVEGAATVRQAAKRAGVSAPTLYRLLKRHGIRLGVRADVAR